MTVTRYLALPIIAALIAGCGAGTTAYTVPAGRGGATVRVLADNFLFEPDTITAPAGDRIILQVQNISSYEHNLTLEDPQGNVLLDLDLPPEKTVTAPEVTLEQTGVYPFYCAKPFHTPLGMKGTITAR